MLIKKITSYFSAHAKGKGGKKSFVFWVSSPIRILASCFGTGSLPASGTFGTLWGIPLFYLLNSLNGLHMIVLFLLITAASMVICHKAGLQSGEPDASAIVLDEAVAFSLTIMLTGNASFWGVLTGFLFFRLFDIAKPYPCSFFDKMKNGFGVVMDDLIAALYAAIMVWLMMKVNVLI